MGTRDFEPTGPMTLSISGMTCDGCAAAVQRLLEKVPGVTRAEVDFATRQAVIEGSAPRQALVAAVQAAGYGVDAFGA